MANFATIDNTWRLVSFHGIPGDPQWELYYLKQYNNSEYNN